MPAAPDTPTHELTADKTLRIKYADRWTIAWKCVLDDKNNVTDLLPARNGLPDGDQAPTRPTRWRASRAWNQGARPCPTLRPTP